MDFIAQHDWLHRVSDSGQFLSEEVLLNSDLHRIISGTFRDPLISDGDSEEDQKHDIESMLNSMQSKVKVTNENLQRNFVPGLRPLPPYPRQSSLTVEKHKRGIRVLAESDFTITSAHNFMQSSQVDKQAFEEMREEYMKEQEEFREWARRMWVEKQCLRALRPLALFERVYEGDWSARAASVFSLPMQYEYAAQINMAGSESECSIERSDVLKKVEITSLPLLTIPPMDRLQTVGNPKAVPEENIPRACRRHPCRIVLPDETRTSTLPLQEIQTELAKFAAQQGVKCIVSEQALRYLVQINTEWDLPVNVEQIFTPCGLQTVVVMDTSVRPRRQLTRARTAQALHLLLRSYLTRKDEHSSPETETEVAAEKMETETQHDAHNNSTQDDPEISDDEIELCIDLGDDYEKTNDKKSAVLKEKNDEEHSIQTSQTESAFDSFQKKHTELQLPNQLSEIFDNCTCKGTPFETPPYTSYTKWLLKKKSDADIPVIIYCSHKHKNDDNSEVILNVIPEYQIETAATAVSTDKLRSCALALRLRDNAKLLSARIDASNGQIVTFQYTEEQQLTQQFGEDSSAECALGDKAIAMIYQTIAQICQLKPNKYILHHEPHHGEYGLLFVASRATDASHTLSLAVDDSSNEEKERKSLQIPPTLSSALLPMHKLRRQLPLAFSPHPLPKSKVARRLTTHERKQAQIAEIRKLKNAKKREKRRLKKKANETNQ